MHGTEAVLKLETVSCLLAAAAITSSAACARTGLRGYREELGAGGAPATTQGAGGTGSSGSSGAGGAGGAACPPPIEPIVLASGHVAYALAIDATHVYWTAGTEGEVWRAPKCGGDAELLAQDEINPDEIAVDDAHVYWVEKHTEGTIRRAPKGGGPATTFVDLGEQAEGLALDATHVYWVLTTGGIGRALKSNGAPELVAGTPMGNAVALDDAYVYVSQYLEIARAPKQGGALATVTTGTNGSATLAVDATSVFWSSWLSGSDGRVSRAPKDGGAATTLAEGQSVPANLAIDDANVYWTNLEGGSVMKAPKAGGPATTVADGWSLPEGVAVDADSVYWVALGDGAIVRAPK